jgi:hypothetical protein
MAKQKGERKYMKKTDGRKNNGAKRGDALVRKTMATPANFNRAKKNRSKILATNAIEEVYGSEANFWKMVAQKAESSQYDRKMVIEYIYGKALDNPDALAQAKNIDFSIVNIFPGTDKKEDVIDITPEDESTKSK